MATSGLEPMPISSLKHDPAWKHCQMFKNNDRVQLKCLYCFKMFGGGGIHRIKEHLACQKGNASCCPRVPADVRNLMLESLEVTMSKKRKKQKINEEDSSNNNHNNINEGNNVVQFIGRPNMYEEHPIVSSSGRNMDKRKRGRPRNSNLNTSLPLVNPEASCLRSNLNSSLPLVNPETSGLRYVEKSKEPESKDPISSDGFDIVEDWVRVAEKDFFGDMDSEWVPLDQPLTTAMLMESLFDEPDDWVAGFKYQEGENELEGDEEDGRR
ncbi:hypothetical protein GIB67_033965 [Kingdonia uniflora]|uniref:BED-type domain-containing protein n=1 Tax=Kingdonia uniflora TaxID=39325 RepID=A0A7J7M5W7_9MAGN|nr:hypothetical protein GIB67_033965 [Kingdonia uniflora]